MHTLIYMGTDLPSHPDVPTYRYPFAGLHPGTFGHMHGEAPTHPSMDICPRIKGSVPSPHYRYTDIYTRKDRHMCGHIGKKGRSHRKKKGGPSYGRADRPMDLGVYVVLCMYRWKYTQSSHFGEKWGCLSVWLGGWVEKMGARFEKKGGRPGKTPARWGKWGWTAEGGEKFPLDCLGITRESRSATEPVGTRLGRGMGLPPSHMLPSPYSTLKRFLEALGNILKPLDVHTPLPTHPCVHVEAVVCQLGLQVCPGAYRCGRKPEIPKRKSLCDARAGITTRTRGFLYPYHGSSSLGSPIHFGLCHLSQWAMYLVIALPGGSGRL